MFFRIIFQPTSGTSECLFRTETVLTLSGATGTIQWEVSNSSASGPFVSIPGAISDSATIHPGSIARYRAIVVDGTCDPFYSDTILINVGLVRLQMQAWTSSYVKEVQIHSAETQPQAVERVVAEAPITMEAIP